MTDSTLSSPWLAQLRQDREHFHLDHAMESDVAVVGAGIAGVSTAWFLLRYTTLKIVLVDAGRIAHGATGRNAGQVVSYFERPLSDLAKVFGAEQAVEGQTLVESAWGLLSDIRETCNLQTPLYGCTGCAGLSTLEQILTRLEEFAIRKEAGVTSEPMLIQAGSPLLAEIPAHLHSYLLEVPHSTILKALATDNPSFIAAEVSKKGCMNSALFCEELVVWMIEHYGDRFTVVEHLPVETITLEEERAVLTTRGPTIKAGRVILCTNGFENFTIQNNAGEQIDSSFHATVHGIIGYMGGYFDEPGQFPTAISYYHRKQSSGPYHYLTRRPYEHEKSGHHSLICIGGPERPLPDRATYEMQAAFPADLEEELDSELRRTYRDMPPMATVAFRWHGLMGYTPNNIRRIGHEPKNPVLLYNLGCNGVGILPSIYGGKRIMQLLSGIHLTPSIFDPDRGHL